MTWKSSENPSNSPARNKNLQKKLSITQMMKVKRNQRQFTIQLKPEDFSEFKWKAWKKSKKKKSLNARIRITMSTTGMKMTRRSTDSLSCPKGCCLKCQNRLTKTTGINKVLKCLKITLRVFWTFHTC